ncbi:hypothetical protein HIDPHFAB_04011 [Nocardioides sp. T2.26MG-1]|nr:hypothetical protein HIDPHFAB_04011 [Nocardioides sp. T2.26MG-1]
MIGLVNRSRTALTALSLVSVLALGACSGDDPEPKFAEPSPSRSLPSSPSTTAVSGPVEPTMPAEAKGTDAAAAEAFVRFYWEMVNYAQATGDLDGLRGLAGPECKPCVSGIRGLERLVERKADVHGGEYDVSDISSAFFDNGGRITVRYKLASSRQVISYPSGKPSTYPAKQVDAMSLLRKDEGRWALEYWGEDPSKR